MKTFRIVMVSILTLLCHGLVRAQDVAIVIGSDIATFNATADAIKTSLAKKGYPHVDIYNIAKDLDFLNKMQTKPYKAFCALGTNPFKKIKEAIKDKPVIFSMVLDPIEGGAISSLEPSGANYAGVSLDVPADVQLKLFKRIVPAAVKLGVIYTVKSERLIAEAKNIQNNFGIQIVAVRIASSMEVPNALRNLPSVDALWIIPDVRVCTKDSMPCILNFAVEKKLPVFGFADYLVKAGALLSYTYDYSDIGEQTAELLAKVLGGESPGSVPVSGPRKVGYAINLKTAKYLGLSFSNAIMRGAEQKIE